MRARFIIDTASAVLHGLRATRLRTALAVLGVSFGVAAVMAVLSIGQGGEARVQDGTERHRHQPRLDVSGQGRLPRIQAGRRPVAVRTGG